MELFSGHFQAKRINSENTIRKLFWLQSVPGAKLQLLKFGAKVEKFQDVLFERDTAFSMSTFCFFSFPFFSLFCPFLLVFFLLSIYQASFQRENFPWRSWNITFKEVSYGWVVERNIHYNNNIFLSYSPVLYFWIIWMHVCFKRSLCLAQVRKINILTHVGQIKILPRVHIFHKTWN